MGASDLHKLQRFLDFLVLEELAELRKAYVFRNVQSKYKYDSEGAKSYMAGSYKFDVKDFEVFKVIF
jgi:hypothetical protein